jgi:hypothetical protein
MCCSQLNGQLLQAMGLTVGTRRGTGTVANDRTDIGVDRTGVGVNGTGSVGVNGTGVGINGTGGLGLIHPQDSFTN